MRDELVKAYDIIKEEQRNADNKANLFIIFITALISFLSAFPITSIEENYKGMEFLFVLLIFVILLFVISLIPIHSENFIFKVYQNRSSKKLNIFYWKSIVQTKNKENFKKVFCNEYSIQEKDINISDIYLLNQIYTNANILERKNCLQKISFTIIEQIILLFLVSIIGHYIFKDELYTMLYILMIFEIIIFNEIITKKIKYIYLKIKKLLN